MAANPNSPFGLSPVGTLLSSPYSGQTMRCLISASDANNMGIGDPVDWYGDADTAGHTPTVKLASAGATNPIAGVITALELDPDNLFQTYRTGSVARYCYVNVDPYAIYEVRAGATVIPYTSVPLNAVLVAGAVNTSTGLSGWYMDSGDATPPAADTTYQLQILGFSPRPNNDIAYAYGVWRVMISLHRLRSGGVDTAGTALVGPLGVA